MARTNYQMLPFLQESIPHTFNSLQKLVMAMAKYQKNRNKKTLFGRDKGQEAWAVFERELKNTILSLYLDNKLDRSASPDEIRKEVSSSVMHFAMVFPNWQDAYSFSREFFDREIDRANDLIGVLKS